MEDYVLLEEVKVMSLSEKWRELPGGTVKNSLTVDLELILGGF